MNDHATVERLAWLRAQPFPKAKRAPERPANWLLDKRYSPKGDESVDKEIRAKLDKIRGNND